MMYLIAQTGLFLSIAWLIGIVVGFALARDQKSKRHAQVEEELRDARNRAIEIEKETEEFRQRVAELEGLPQGARASRVAARDEMVARMTTLERELDLARNNEKRLSDETERLRSDVDGFRTRYLEARAKWDEYQAKAEALAAPQPLHLGEAQIVGGGDEATRQRVNELEGRLMDAGRARDRASEQAQTLSARVVELEAQVGSAGKGGERGGDEAKAMRARIAELESRLAAGFSAARDTDALKTRIADLQDKLSEAEVALRKSIGATKQEGEPLRARINELEAQLARAKPAPAEPMTLKSLGEASALRTRLAEVETKLAEAQRQASEAQSLRLRLAEAERNARSGGNDEEVRRLQSRNADLEQTVERARRQASDAQSLRTQVTSLEARLQATENDRGPGATGEDVQLLKARLADVEARLMASSSSSMEFESLRSRVMTLEALLHEAAKSRDEAAILRSKVAELDGRLGQAMKAASRRADENV